MKISELFFLLFLITLLVLGLLWKPTVAKAFTVGVVVNPSDYQQCVDTCLAYNGYDIHTYNFCQNECSYPGPVIVVGPVWVRGRYYPHGYGRHFSPRPDGHNYNGRR